MTTNSTNPVDIHRMIISSTNAASEFQSLPSADKNAFAYYCGATGNEKLMAQMYSLPLLIFGIVWVYTGFAIIFGGISAVISVLVYTVLMWYLSYMDQYFVWFALVSKISAACGAIVGMICWYNTDDPDGPELARRFKEWRAR